MVFKGLPQGLGMALAQNSAALNRYQTLSDAEKNELIEKAKNASSKKEMENLVSSLTNQNSL